MAGPFKMKGSPMARNYGAPFKANESVKDNTNTTKAKEVSVKKELYRDKVKDDFVGDFFNKETIGQANAKEVEANRAQRKKDSDRKAKEANAKKRAEIAKKEAEYMKKAKALVKSGNAKKSKDYQTKADLKKKIKIIKDNS